MPNGLISKMEAVCQVVILMTYDSDILGVVMQICQYSSPHDLGNVHILRLPSGDLLHSY